MERMFPVWLRNQLISDGLEAVLTHTEKSSITDNYPHIFKQKSIIKLIPVLLALSLGLSG